MGKHMSGQMGWKVLGVITAGAVALGLSALSAQAGATWEVLKPDVFGDRTINDGRGIIEFSAPNRPLDQSHVPVSIKAKLSDGRTISKVYFIVDENPMPVAAKFDMGEGRTAVSLAAKFRFNSATDTRAVVEASDGQLYMVSQHTKFAGGQASCSAPPNGDPKEIAANMGKMTLAHEAAPKTMTQLRPKAKLTVSHPNHTGMVLDQITLLYVPLKMMEKVDVRQGDDLVFSMTGSITLSQDPEIAFDYRVNGATELKVTASDSDKTEWTKTFPIGQGS
ncbi:MAG: quinoprotein dehydrogenase-associated SoxYZ-like carrier [Alphaproteobacteria bacterium]|nr:quinoprotein dehydrogenase-associated SoxYZ-like carrier [Alphaproteobacteria bacterium]